MIPPSAPPPTLAQALRGNPGAWFGADSYPPAALRRGAQGRTVARLAVDAGGRVSACVITTTSGDADLDATTCRIARRVVYRPATDARGRPIGASVVLPVRWVLPADAWPRAPEREDAVGPALRHMDTSPSTPEHRHRRDWLDHLIEAHHLVGGVALLLGALATRLRRWLGWGTFDADGRTIAGDQPFAMRRRRGKRWDRSLRVAGAVLPIVLVAIGLAWIGW